MSSRRTGIEDLKSDLICRVFAPQTWRKEGKCCKKGSNWSNSSKCQSEFESAFLKRSTGGLWWLSRWLCGHESRICNASSWTTTTTTTATTTTNTTTTTTTAITSVVMKVELARLVSMIRSNLHCYHQMHLQSCKYRGWFVALHCYNKIQSPTYRWLHACLKDLLQITYVGHCRWHDTCLKTVLYDRSCKSGWLLCFVAVKAQLTNSSHTNSSERVFKMRTVCFPACTHCTV